MCLERTTEGWVGVDCTDGGGKTVPYVGAGHWEGHLPNCVLLRLTAAARVVEERSWRTFVESAEANTIRSERYDGHRRWKVWCMIVAILKVTRYLTGSQCSFWSAVVTCDLRSSPSARRAAAFCACWLTDWLIDWLIDWYLCRVSWSVMLFVNESQTTNFVILESL